MKKWWQKFGCFLTGWNSDILKLCTEASRKQLKKYTSAMLILMILWAFVGYLLADRYVGVSLSGGIIASIIAVIIVVQIERQIILSVEKNNWLVIFRLILAVLMAVIGSAIIDQIIFKDDIEKKMIEIVDRQVKEQLPNRLMVIDSKLIELQSEADSLNQVNLKLYDEIAKRPTINTVSSSTTRRQVQQEDGSFIVVPETTISTTPLANPKAKEAEINNQRLEGLREQQENYTRQKMEAEKNLREELKSKHGFLEELNAMIEILKESTVALIFYLILFVFLMSLELFVVVSKLGDKKSDYDLIVEHQLEQKIKTLAKLKEAKG